MCSALLQDWRAYRARLVALEGSQALFLPDGEDFEYPSSVVTISASGQGLREVGTEPSISHRDLIDQSRLNEPSSSQPKNPTSHRSLSGAARGRDLLATRYSLNSETGKNLTIFMQLL